MLGGDRRGQFDGVACAIDIGPVHGLGAGLQVVDCRKVEEVGDFATQFALGRGVNAASCFAEVADDGMGA